MPILLFPNLVLWILPESISINLFHDGILFINFLYGFWYIGLAVLKTSTLRRTVLFSCYFHTTRRSSNNASLRIANGRFAHNFYTDLDSIPTQAFLGGRWFCIHRQWRGAFGRRKCMHIQKQQHCWCLCTGVEVPSCVVRISRVEYDANNVLDQWNWYHIVLCGANSSANAVIKSGGFAECHTNGKEDQPTLWVSEMRFMNQNERSRLIVMDHFHRVLLWFHIAACLRCRWLRHPTWPLSARGWA